jgi:hypothetical protein
MDAGRYLRMAMVGLCMAGGSVSARAATVESEAKRIANAYGVSRFDQVEAIRYTFHVSREGQLVERRWVWEPEGDRVRYEGPDQEGNMVEKTYARKELTPDATDLLKIDAMFMNDQYWLIFPYHLVWDKGVTLTAAGNQPLPLPPGKALKLTVAYPSEGGYTPGDAYDLFYGSNGILKQWIYRKGGTAPARASLWAPPQKVGPLLISVDHQGEGFRVWFDNVEVKLKGKGEWQGIGKK